MSLNTRKIRKVADFIGVSVERVLICLGEDPYPYYLARSNLASTPQEARKAYYDAPSGSEAERVAVRKTYDMI